MHKLFLGIFGITATIMIGAAGCSQKLPASQAESVFKPVATLQEIMVSVIDPNIDPIWNSISTVTTQEGTVEKKPQTDEEWNTLRNHALTLIEVSNLLTIEGRPIARPGVTTSTHASEFGPEEVKKTIDANRADFNKRAQALQESVKLLLVAIEAKNTDELADAGGVVDQACEECHKQFWYPNDKRPTTVEIPQKVGAI